MTSFGVVIYPDALHLSYGDAVWNSCIALFKQGLMRKFTLSKVDTSFFSILGPIVKTLLTTVNSDP